MIPIAEQHDLLLANVLAKGEPLAFGKTVEQVEAEGTSPAPSSRTEYSMATGSPVGCSWSE